VGPSWSHGSTDSTAIQQYGQRLTTALLSLWMQDTGCIPRVRVFRSMRRAFQLVPGVGYRAPGTQDPINAEARRPSPTTGKRAHRVCMMQDRKGSDPGYPVPGTWYLAPMPHSHISNLSRASLLVYIGIFNIYLPTFADQAPRLQGNAFFNATCPAGLAVPLTAVPHEDSEDDNSVHPGKSYLMKRSSVARDSLGCRWALTSALSSFRPAVYRCSCLFRVSG